MKIVNHQNTKIVATVGPASSSLENLTALVKAGVDVFRLNFSHGSHEDHLAVIQRIEKINKEHDLNIGILGDLQGPKLRVGKILNNRLDLTEGQILTFTNEVCIGTAEKIYMSYENFARDVTPGEKVLVDDGKIELQVVETDGESTVKLKVLFGDVLSSNKGVNLPQTKITLPSLTEKDRKDLEFILTQKINWIALSFVRHEDDIHDLRKRIKAANHPGRIIAKMEKPEAVERMEQIVQATDAVMVARGDLGVEVPMERLPLIQKEIIRLCIKNARPVIVATQMMDSMITSPSPTRAEITDVANAVFDGADAVMLSGETSVGRHPVRVVEAMNKIIDEAEKEQSIYHKGLTASVDSPTYLSDALCYNACRLAEGINAKAIIGMTESGYTGFLLSSCRPNSKIYIFSHNHDILGTLNLVWGIRGQYYDRYVSTDETIKDVQEILKEKERVVPGDIVINTGSMPIEERLRTNMLKITVVK